MTFRHRAMDTDNPERVVVLGAGGVIGRALCERLVQDGTPVLPLGRNDIDLLAADAAARLKDLLDPSDRLVVLSALTPGHGRNAGILCANLVMAANVCAALKAVPVASVVYASSDAVYPRRGGVITEDSCSQPTDTYSAMHKVREVMFRETVQGPLAILRMTQVYAAHDTHNAYGPCRFIREALQHNSISLFGDGEELRDHISIDDVIDVYVECLDKRWDGVFNVTTGRAVTFDDLAKAVCAALPQAIEIKHLERKIPVSHRHFDNTLIRQTFPDFAPTSITERLPELIREIRDNLASRPGS